MSRDARTRPSARSPAFTSTTTTSTQNETTGKQSRAWGAVRRDNRSCQSDSASQRAAGATQMCAATGARQQLTVVACRPAQGQNGSFANSRQSQNMILRSVATLRTICQAARNVVRRTSSKADTAAQTSQSQNEIFSNRSTARLVLPRPCEVAERCLQES